MDREDWTWFFTVLACCLFVAAILIGWSQLRGY
jgi:hypothetical protein